jgi:hypothetical protein
VSNCPERAITYTDQPPALPACCAFGRYIEASRRPPDRLHA